MNETSEEHSLRKIKLTIAYDGNNFCGWQIQAHGRTVQGEVEKALSRMHKSEISVVAAGRTDAGVHARGQVIHFTTHIKNIEEYQFVRAASSYFPKDIAAVRAEVVSLDFHARRSAGMRQYRYYIYASPVRMPQYRNYSLRICRYPNIALLNRYASLFCGEHDFTTFSQSNVQTPNRVCTVYSAHFYPQGEFIVFNISAKSFLWKMVRSLVGSMLDYEQKNYSPEQVAEFLNARDRSLAGMTAQARGLVLDRVWY